MSESLNIILAEPFFGGSHQRWAEELQRHSRHRIHLMTLPARHWKWRMHGAAVTLARQFADLNGSPDLLLTTDMLDVATFLGLTRTKSAGLPVALYFHENQISYPWSARDPDIRLNRNNQYGFINFCSALVADHCFFNSHYHQQRFLQDLPDFLRQFPDHRELQSVDLLRNKSSTLPLGLELPAFRQKEQSGPPIVLWNHRWEYDKDPETFFRVLFQLQEEGSRFRLVVCGEQYREAPPIFAEAQRRLRAELIHFGYATSTAAYQELLQQADILPVTSRQDFFGGSVVEAMAAGCYPLLPNRLAYPEHIPADRQDTYLYHTEEELLQKLRGAFRNIDDIRTQATEIVHFVKRYDWLYCIELYDEAFAKMTS